MARKIRFKKRYPNSSQPWIDYAARTLLACCEEIEPPTFEMWPELHERLRPAADIIFASFFDCSADAGVDKSKKF